MNGKRLRDESESDSEITGVAKKTRTLVSYLILDLSRIYLTRNIQPPPPVRPPRGYYINRFGVEVRITVPAELNPLSTYNPPKDTLYPYNDPSESNSKFIKAWDMARFRSQRRLGRGGWHERSWERKERVPSPLKNEVEADEAPPSEVYQFTFRVPFLRSVSLTDLNLDLTRHVTRVSSSTSLRLRLHKWLFGRSAA